MTTTIFLPFSIGNSPRSTGDRQKCTRARGRFPEAPGDQGLLGTTDTQPLYNHDVAKAKHYVVWKGRRTGIFPSWAECEKQVKGYVGAEFKAFGTLAEARQALAAGYSRYRGQPASMGKWRTAARGPAIPSLSADAACSGSPGRLEYRVVETESGQLLLKAGPFSQGTNNVGEFLAIADALRWLRRQRLDWPVYSDSENAIGWIQRGKCNTKLARTDSNRRLFELIAQAEAELPTLVGGGLPRSRILKWDTKKWGEIPADFGRK